MYSLEKMENSVVKVKVLVEGEEFKKERAEILNKFKDAKVDGFRKGHVPADVIEKQFAGNIREELYNKLVNREFGKALEENEEIVPMTQLEVVSEEITKEKLEVVISFEAVPTFDMPNYENLELEEIKVEEVSDENVDMAIDQMLEKRKVLEKVEKEVAEDKDVVNIDFEGFVDGVAFPGGKAEKFDLVLGSKSFIDTFEEQIVGHKVNDEFEVNVKFPEEYHAENLKGKDAMFKVKLNEIKVEKKPELDEEFAKKEGYDSVKDYKIFVKSQLELQRAASVNNQKFQMIADKLVESLDIVVPEKALAEQTNKEIEDFKAQLTQYGQNFDEFLEKSKKTLEDFTKDAKERAINTIKFRLIASKLIKDENLSVTNEEIDAKLSLMAASYGMKLEQIKEELQKMNLLENYANDIANNIVTEKLKEFLISKNTK